MNYEYLPGETYLEHKKRLERSYHNKRQRVYREKKKRRESFIERARIQDALKYIRHRESIRKRNKEYYERRKQNLELLNDYREKRKLYMRGYMHKVRQAHKSNLSEK